MKLSAELTLYPLQDNYLIPIEAVIEKLHNYNSVEVNTFPTATIIIGDYDAVFSVISETIKWSYQKYGKCVFVTKFLPDYEAREI